MKNKQRVVAATLLVMRITFTQIAISVIFAASVYANEANSQSILDKSFTISVENVQLKKVISFIQRQTKVKFVFSPNAINAERTVTYSVQGKKIVDFLEEIMRYYNIDYQVVDDQIILYPAGTKALNNTGTEETNPVPPPADKTITGTVTSDKGEPLTGVTVTEKNKPNAVVTDDKGFFSIKVADENAVLIFSSIGFLNKEVPVSNQTTLNIVLTTTDKSLEEVIVVGYGTKKRSDVTGAVASVPKTRLSQLPVTNMMHAVEGSVAGVTVTQTSSVPGSAAAVLVRGQNTITARTAPFLVVDGIPFTSAGGLTNDINPNDIASIEILKDASATAIYGVNGANGVILITTKRGTSGKPVIRYNGFVGFDNIAHMLKPLSPEDYVKKYADYKIQVPTAPQTVLMNASEIANYNAGKTVDWMDEVTQQGILQDHNVSVSGGSKDVKYYLSGNYMKQKGAVRGYQYHRASIRSTLDATITDFLSAGVNLYYTNNNYDGGRANFYLAAAMSPYGTLYNPTGSFEIYPMYPELLYANPLLGLYTDRVDRAGNLTGNGYVEVKPGGVLTGLKYRLNTGYTYLTSRTGSYTGRSANNTLGSASTSSSETNSWVVENILTYEKNFGLHHIDVTGLYSAQQRNYFAMAFNATGFINDELSFYNIGAGATISAGTIFSGQPYTGSYRDKYALLSQMGRINYSYDGKYLLTLTARRDGSSVMGANTDKYGTFPSIAAGWNIFKEKFMSGVRFIDNLKLRLSYGKAGNEAISIYQTITTENTVRYPFAGLSTIGVLASNLGNSNLFWESATTFNAGLDFAVLNNRISGSLDIYRTSTEDILLRRNLPIITGYANIVDNLGQTKNNGVEVSLNSKNVVTKDFNWESSIVFSANKNKIVDLYGDKKDDLGNRWFIGHPIGIIYDYKMIGVWQPGEDRSQVDPSAKDGDLKFADINGDKVINASDRSILGQTSPKWTGGITNTFHYKNLHLNIFIQTVQGALKNNVTLTYADEAGRMNIPADAGYWTVQNKSNTRPSLGYTNTRGYGYPSDNSYTRIKDVTLSYTFSQHMLDKLKLSSLTIYASGRNLYTFTDWIGWDPEHNYSFRGSGDWTNNYPLTRSVVFGVNVTLR